MEHVFAVKNPEELARYQAFLQDVRPRLEDYIRFLRSEYQVKELPRCIVWSNPDIAVRLVSGIPVPAYTNEFRVMFTPDLDVWRDIYLRQLDGLPESYAVKELREYYDIRLSRNSVLQILGHELAHYSELFLDDFDTYPSPSTWFEEGMVEYISRKWFLTGAEFDAEAQANRHLTELLGGRYGGHPLEDFGAHLKTEDHAGLFFDYWRAFLAVSRVVEACGGVLEAFRSYRLWCEAKTDRTLADWFGADVLRPPAGILEGLHIDLTSIFPEE
ncbi:MAG: elongation factor Tu [Oscillospiraceae bacterium]|jgi:hypothetical protein|nr:elongation factor Tu [Oscillospiraceae bacterium]